MTRTVRAPDTPTLPQDELIPGIAVVLTTGEGVYWQAQMLRSGASVLWLLPVLAIALWWVYLNGYLQQVIVELRAKPILLGGILGMCMSLPLLVLWDRQPHYYAITTARVLS